MEDVALQLEANSLNTINTNDNIIFDNIIVNTGNIYYNQGTGTIEIYEPGVYYINWWVAVQSANSSNGSAFSLVASNGLNIKGNSPIKTDEVTGTAVIDNRFGGFVSFTIVNDSTGTIYPSNVTVAKAALSLVGIRTTDIIRFETAYGFIYNDNTQDEYAIELNNVIPFNNNVNMYNIGHTPSSSTIFLYLYGRYLADYTVLITNNIEATIAIQSGGNVLDYTELPIIGQPR